MAEPPPQHRPEPPPQHRPEPPPEPRPEPPQDRDPRREPVYRAILAVLAASVIAGAVLTLTGESLFGSRALANAGLGMAVVCLALYWFFRLLGRRAARKRQDQDRDRDRNQEQGQDL